MNDLCSRPRRARPDTVLTGGVVQVWALYCLVTFYVALSEELQSRNPLLTFRGPESLGNSNLVDYFPPVSGEFLDLNS